MSITHDTTSTVTGLDVSVYLTSDPKRSVAFYRDVLGFKPSSGYDERGAEFEFADGSTFGVWKPDREPFKGGTVMFAVADIDAAIAEFRSRGAELSDAEETPACFMAFGQDPDGNPYIIHQRKPAP